ncbi:MAG: hypothetical protein EU981_05050 [Candidatus Liberibacter ctenarytainae]|uniref:Lipoprotein n=1 Tax=Candidatus Liberibacter ctenarytainae TaxID=2020335 RepID=A0A937AL51_9HYPH|nr:hypothetical protein [Candidatus Liberibacter ctenarytainae]
MGIKKQLVITSLLSTAAVLGGCDLLENKDVKRAEAAAKAAQEAAETALNAAQMAVTTIKATPEADTAEGNNQDDVKIRNRRQAIDKAGTRESERQRESTDRNQRAAREARDKAIAANKQQDEIAKAAYTAESNNQDADKIGVKEQLQNKLVIANIGKTRALKTRERWSNKETEATEEVDKEECRDQIKGYDIALQGYENDIANAERKLNEINESQ